jgi:predicted DNA-binding transcriptional regulator YafY
VRLPDPQLCYGLRQYLDAAHRGRSNSVSGKALAERFGVHPRRIGEAVSFLVSEGWPIAATASAGYWLIETEEERQAALKPERRRLAAISRRLRGLDRALAARIQTALNFGGTP